MDWRRELLKGSLRQFSKEIIVMNNNFSQYQTSGRLKKMGCPYPFLCWFGFSRKYDIVVLVVVPKADPPKADLN